MLVAQIPKNKEVKDLHLKVSLLSRHDRWKSKSERMKLFDIIKEAKRIR